MRGGDEVTRLRAKQLSISSWLRPMAASMAASRVPFGAAPALYLSGMESMAPSRMAATSTRSGSG